MFTKGRGSEVIWGVADYWVSRVTWSPEEQSYHLLGKHAPFSHCSEIFTKTSVTPTRSKLNCCSMTLTSYGHIRTKPGKYQSSALPFYPQCTTLAFSHLLLFC